MTKCFRTVLRGIFLALCVMSSQQLSASQKGPIDLDHSLEKSVGKISYEKVAYEGFGHPSKVNGLPRTKNISGHYKRTNNGVVRVDPYWRSK